MTQRPDHHGRDGRFRNPWPLGPAAPPGQGDVLRWMWERVRHGRAPDPAPEELPRAEPDVASPRVAPDVDELRITCVGHATFLIQLPGVTLLTDPMFSQRASPFRRLGPRRLSAPGLELSALPPVDAVLLSHDHYDHLDARTVDTLHDRFGDALVWFTPLGYEEWFAGRGVTTVRELDWWESERLQTEGGSGRVRALPALHWSRRRLFDIRRRLWCSWSLEWGGRRIYFGGDSGYCPVFGEIGERAGPFDVAIIPIGAYEPRWFMRSSHMNPEEAAQTCRDIRAERMVGMHWGTFRLADEPPLDPPHRARRAWESLGLPAADLYIPEPGRTLRF